MQRLLYELQPDVLGQRASAQSIDVERIAVNLMDAAKTDNDGFSPEEELVCGFEEAAYFSNTLFRYGLFQNMELRLGGDAFLYQQQGANQGMEAALAEIEPMDEDQAVLLFAELVREEPELDLVY